MKKNIYDERVYLSGSSYALKALEQKRKIETDIYNEEISKYKDLLQQYKIFVQKVAELLKGLKLSNPLAYSLALSYLIKRGYLSKDLHFRFEESPNEVSVNYGMNILAGFGICRNFADMQKDVLDALGEYVKKFYCVEGVSMAKARKKKANHVINLIRYDGVLYGIDLFNDDKLYHFKDKFILSEISFESSTKLRYKPYLDFTIDGNSMEEIFATLRLFEEESRKKPIFALTYEDEIIPDILEYLRKEHGTFMDFHAETKDLRENIVESISHIR